MDEIIKVENLVKRYNGEGGVGGVSLSLKPGRVLAYLGHNGAGKTTTLRTILGLLRPDSGAVWYDGKVYDTLSSDYDLVRGNYGVCLDIPGFYPAMTAQKNLELFAGLYGLSGDEFRSRSAGLLERLGLAAAACKPVKTFSKGMAQKLALARALLHKPRVLFLDEPMSGLDPEARVLVREFIRELADKDGTAVFMTSHDLAEVEQMADEIYILEKGKVSLSGELKELKASFASEYRYSLKLAGGIPAEKAAAIAAALGAAAHKYADSELEAEFKAEVPLEAAAAACASAGARLAEFKRRSVSLEEIYFASVKRNENKN